MIERYNVRNFPELRNFTQCLHVGKSRFMILYLITKHETTMAFYPQIYFLLFFKPSTEIIIILLHE